MKVDQANLERPRCRGRSGGPRYGTSTRLPVSGRDDASYPTATGDSGSDRHRFDRRGGCYRPVLEHTGQTSRCFHSGFANRRVRCRSCHGNSFVRSVFNPASAGPSRARERLHIQRLVCILADVGLSGGIRPRWTDW